MTQQWLSIVEYAHAYRMSDMTVRRRIKTGKLHAVLKDGKYFIPVDLAEGRASSVVPQPPQPQVRYPSSHGANVPQASRHEREVSPMKSHPAAHKSFAHVPPHHEPRQHALAPEPPAPVNDFDEMANDAASMPVSLRRPLAGHDTSLVDTRALLAYCDASLRKVTENERRTVEKFKSKLEALEATLASRDQEIQMLRQKTEDLQLLISFIEKK